MGNETAAKSAWDLRIEVDRLIDSLVAATEAEATSGHSEETDEANESGRADMLNDILSELDAAITTAEGAEGGAETAQDGSEWGGDALTGLRAFRQYLADNYE